MTLKEFRKNLQRGHGRCYLELSGCENIEKYRTAVLWGCLQELAFDPQSEGTRAAFLYRLISHFPDREFFAKQIAERYRTISGRDTWLFQQLTELLSCFAADGDPVAREALSEKYAALHCRLLNKRSFRGYDHGRDNFEFLSLVFLDLPEYKTLEALISDYGALFLKNPHYDLGWDFAWFASRLEEKVGKMRLPRLLKKQEATPEGKAFIGSYCAMVEQRLQRNAATSVPLEALTEKLEGGQKLSRLEQLAFLRKGDDEEKRKLAERIEAETSPEKQAELLGVFRTEAYPGDHDRLVELADSDHEALSTAAREVLENCRHEAVYRYAKARFAEAPSDPSALRMLLMNYRPTDKPLLLSALYDLNIDHDDTSQWHGTVMQILEAHDRGIRLPREFFAFIYDTSLCSCCRHSAVRHMKHHRWLTPQMLEECKYDCNTDTVSLVSQINRRASALGAVEDNGKK